MNFIIRIKASYLTLLLAINSFVFLLVILAEVFFGVTEFYEDDITLFGGVVLDDGMLNNIGTLITSTFLHLNLFHFLVNMYSLYRIGQIIESYFDGRKLFITYIVGGLSGSLATVLVYLLINEDIATIGASGAIFALIGLLIGGTLKRYRYGFQLPFALSDVLFVALLALSIGIIPGTRINNVAHIGGLISGIVLGLFFKHSLGTYETPFEKSIVNISLRFSEALLISSYVILFLGIVL